MEIRDQILQAALRVYGDLGYRGATTRRIAQEAGVNEVTLFRHFGSKSQLIHEALSRGLPELEVEALPEEPLDPAMELRAWARAHLRHLHALRSVIRTGMSECEEHADLSESAGERPRRVAQELKRYLGRVKRRGLSAVDFDPQSAALMLMGVVFADAMSRDIMPDMFRKSLERAADEYVELFLRAIAVEPAGGRGGDDQEGQ